MTDLPADFWAERFARGETPWERGELHPALLAWQRSGALQPCRILVPGAGRSPEPATLLGDGFDVMTLDLTESAVQAQAAALGAARSVHGDATAWRPAEPFDAVYDQTCLCALPPALWPAYEASLRAWLRPGGRLFVLFMQTERRPGPPFDCPIPAMRELFAAWTWPAALGEPVPHGFAGQEIPVVLHRAEAA